MVVFDVDIYVLCPRRDLETVARFRERWLDGMSEAAEDYPFPGFPAPPETTYDSPWTLAERLVREPSRSYAIYWSAGRRAPLLAAMLFFTSDGGLIAGLTLPDREDGGIARALIDLAESLGGRFGMTLWEQPPPERAADFLADVRTAAGPKLVEGALLG
jgi:hypothetical protein